MTSSERKINAVRESVSRYGLILTAHADEEAKEEGEMKCDLCEGEYREKTVTRNYKWHGKITVIEDVPALVCDHCGDVLIREETIKAPAFFLPQVFLILRVYTVCSG